MYKIENIFPNKWSWSLVCYIFHGGTIFMVPKENIFTGSLYKHALPQAFLIRSTGMLIKNSQPTDIHFSANHSVHKSREMFCQTVMLCNFLQTIYISMSDNKVLHLPYLCTDGSRIYLVCVCIH